MIEIVFQGLSRVGNKTIGPAPAFRVAANFIRAEPAGTILARYEDYHWVVNTQTFTSYRCRGAATIQFEECLGGTSAEYGPFDDIHCADGAMYCKGSLFTRFVDESLLWMLVETNTHWPMLLLKTWRAQAA